MNKPLWQPGKQLVADANLTKFTNLFAERLGLDIPDYDTLHVLSVKQMDEFWSILWDFADIKAQTRGERVIENPGQMPGTSFFPDARLNFAENLLVRRDDGPAMLFRGEDKVEYQLSWAELYALVSRLADAFKASGLKAGDRVAAIMPNMPETIAAMLAVASIGGIWSSCSPDFGERGILDRFGQIDPVAVICCDGYWYNSKRFMIGDKVETVIGEIPSVDKVIVVDYLGEAAAVAETMSKAVTWQDFIAPFAPGEIQFASLPFGHPLYILFSSGTTGAPKCIVHSAGGTLLQHAKELRLHYDLKPHDRLFYFSTCGWMMWNWLASGLSAGATLLLYDGSPFAPDGNVLFDYAEQSGMTVFGTSAKYIDAVKKAGLRPQTSHDLSKLRTMISTGSPLAAESFEFVYDAIKSDICLSSMSGGTDIVSCFVGGNPIGPVWSGEIQGRGLGMAVDVFDASGRPLARGKGELVCTAPFPSMPLGFWNDPAGEKYHNAYFDRFENVWCHGDFAEFTEHGGIIIHGRSDATLNPGGVRIGTAEIYAQVEQLSQVTEAIAIGQDWQDDVRIVLFVVLADDHELDDELIGIIKQRIKTGASPRHVPARIVQVADIPRTKSGKITELAVRDIVHGREVKNVEALANPEALDMFRNLDALKT
jgi:acetoacetyl-CoA synthetase